MTFLSSLPQLIQRLQVGRTPNRSLLESYRGHDWTQFIRMPMNRHTTPHTTPIPYSLWNNSTKQLLIRTWPQPTVQSYVQVNQTRTVKILEGSMYGTVRRFTGPPFPRYRENVFVGETVIETLADQHIELSTTYAVTLELVETC